MKHDPRLIPVDEMCNTLQREIDEKYWEGNDDNLEFLEKEYKWFLSLQAKGIAYDTTW